MAVSMKIDPIDREINLMISQTLSVEAQSRLLAEFAIEALDSAKTTNKNILGRVPFYRKFVDGSEGADEESVKPTGTIVYEFEIVTDVLYFIGTELEKHSPYLHGTYRQSHTLYADGIEVKLGGQIPTASEFVFLSDLPYSSKIEHGSSSQAPDGVYEITANNAKRRFGNVARIEFNYRSTFGGTTTPGPINTKDNVSLVTLHQNKSANRFPAIIVRLGGR